MLWLMHGCTTPGSICLFAACYIQQAEQPAALLTSTVAMMFQESKSHVLYRVVSAAAERRTDKSAEAPGAVTKVAG